MESHISSAVLASAVATCLALATGCQTSHRIIVEQPKPLDINVNLSGRIELVITDARRDVERITGEKPKRVVNPEDIGLPAELLQGSSLPMSPDGAPLAVEGAHHDAPMLLLADLGGPRGRPVASDDALKQAMAARNAEVTKLLDAQVVGEAHTGLLATRGRLSADQQKTFDAENRDRQSLYEQEAKAKNTAIEKVAIAYYLARLGHLNKGAWYEKYNKETKAWEWEQMK